MLLGISHRRRAAIFYLRVIKQDTFTAAEDGNMLKTAKVNCEGG